LHTPDVPRWFASLTTRYICAHPLRPSIPHAGFHADGRRYESSEWPLARALRDCCVIADEEIHIPRGDGNKGLALVSAAPVRNSEGGVLAGIVVCSDVTDLRRMQEDRARLLAAEQAALATRDLMSTVSHELR
jgi:hypothetical protein